MSRQRRFTWGHQDDELSGPTLDGPSQTLDVESSSVSTRLPGDSAVLVSLLQGVASGVLPSQTWLWVSASAPHLSLSPLPSDGYSPSLRFFADSTWRLSPIFLISSKCHLHNAMESSTVYQEGKKKSEKNGGDVYLHSTTSWNLKAVIRQFSSFDFLSHGWFSLVVCIIHIFLPGSSHHSWDSSLLFILRVSFSSTQFIFPCFPLCFFPGSSFHPRTLSSPGSPIHRSLMSLLSVAMAPGLSALICLPAPTRRCLYATHVPRTAANT